MEKESSTSVKKRSSGAASSRPGPKPDPSKPRSRYNPARAETKRKNVRLVMGGECRNGHVLTEENTRYEGKYLRCTICSNNYNRVKRGAPPTDTPHPKGSDHCAKGHPYEQGKRQRICQTCRRDNWLQKTYGVTLEQWEDLLFMQGGKCAICRCDVKELTPKHRHVDHDHKTGAVRGILCHSCNTALGLLGDDTVTLRRAVDYLSHE